MMLNGTLGALVAITAASGFVAPSAAILIGCGSGFIAVFGVILVEKIGIDDPIGAVAVHGMSGVWGTLATGLQATRGGVLRVIAALQLPRAGAPGICPRRRRGKMALTVRRPAGGASIGREGRRCTSARGSCGRRRFGSAVSTSPSRFLLAGGARGHRGGLQHARWPAWYSRSRNWAAPSSTGSRATLLTAVIVGGVVSLGVLGNYTYFGQSRGILPLGQGWLAVLLRRAVRTRGRALQPAAAPAGTGDHGGRLRARHPVRSPPVRPDARGAGHWSHRRIRHRLRTGAWLVQGQADGRAEFGIAQAAANSRCPRAGIPGGLFSPALAVGAGLGDNISALLPASRPTAVVLLGMCGVSCRRHPGRR